MHINTQSLHQLQPSRRRYRARTTSVNITCVNNSATLHSVLQLELQSLRIYFLHLSKNLLRLHISEYFKKDTCFSFNQETNFMLSSA